MKFLTIYFSCLLICSGYGITFSLFSLLVNATGVSGKWIGINAALPALGWIFGSVLVPYLQLRLQIGIKKIALSFLLLAGIGACTPLLSESYVGLSFTRLAFGGTMGVFLRCVEYILVANSPHDKRGRYLAIYGATFLVGIIVGSSVQPALAGGLTFNVAIVVSLVTIGGAIFSRAEIGDSAWVASKLTFSAFALVPLLPVAFMGVVAYALYEFVPAYLLQIFALRSGTGEAVAAYTLTAAALGNLFLLFPLLLLSDKLGRVKILASCAIVAAIIPFAIPSAIAVPTVFLGLVAILGASAGASYALSLAMLGDRFEGQSLVLANAIFGMFYAIGSVLGPLLHGYAVELAGPEGLMISISGIYICLIMGMIVIAVVNGARSRHV